MKYVSTPEHFPDFMPDKLLELPHALGVTATAGEVQRLYLEWTTFYHEALSGQFRLPNGRNVNNLGYGVVEIGPAASSAETGYVRVQHQKNIGEPTVVILQSSQSAVVKVNKQHQSALVAFPSGSTLYRISDSKIMYMKMAANNAVLVRQRANSPSFLDLLQLDALLCQITTPEQSEEKRRFVGRFLDLFKGRLFKRPTAND